jgi:CrcB protein
MKLAFLAAGGAAGALLRYAVSGLSYRYMGAGFTWGTLCVNVLGALAIGLLSGIMERFMVSANVRTLLLVGLLGAFTTFSTFSLECLNMFRAGQGRLALVNILATNVTCLIAVYLGFILSRALVALIK